MGGNYEIGQVEKKMHLLSWGKITRPKENGGLGIIPLEVKNKAMLGKWWFKWRNERGSQWNKIIRAKYNYDKDVDLDSLEISTRYSSIWNNIIKVNNKEGFDKALESKNCKWTVKNGESTLFWEDWWYGDKSFNITYQRLYNLCKIKKVVVKDFIGFWQNDSTRSEHLWKRELRAWELEEVVKLNEVIESFTFKIGVDSLAWSGSGSEYSSKKGCLYLTRGSEGFNLKWRKIWKIKAPPKVLLFLWKLENNIVPTKVFLMNRLKVMNSNVFCGRCRQSIETQDHIFWHCTVARKAWQSTFRWWGFNVDFSTLNFIEVWSWIFWFRSQAI